MAICLAFLSSLPYHYVNLTRHLFIDTNYSAFSLWRLQNAVKLHLKMHIQFFFFPIEHNRFLLFFNSEPTHCHTSKEDETASVRPLDIPGSRGRTPAHARHYA